MLITILKRDSSKDDLTEIESYELKVIQLSDFNEWKDFVEINKSLADLLNEIPSLTLTEDAQSETFIAEVKIVLPQNTLENLERDNEEEKLFSTDFTKQRKNLLINVFKELSFRYSPTEEYEVKIS